MKWILRFFLYLIVTSVTFQSNFALSSVEDLSKCVRILSPFIDIAHDVPENSLILEEAVNLREQLHQDMKQNGGNLFPIDSKKIKFTDIRVLRQGVYLGYMAFYEGKPVLLQDNLTDDEFILLARAPKDSNPLPLIGHVVDTQEHIRPVKPLVSGFGLLPPYSDINIVKHQKSAAIAFPRFNMQQIIAFESLLRSLEANFNINIFPNYDAKNEEEIFKQILLAAKFVFKNDQVYLESFDFTWLLKNDKTQYELFSTDSQLRPGSWTNWLRAYLMRNMAPLYFDMYRAYLWKTSPSTALSLDFLNFALTKSYKTSKLFPSLSLENQEQVSQVTDNVHTDMQTPYTRPQQLQFEKKRLNYHFKKHGGLTRTSSKEEYEKKAIRFISRRPGHGRLYQVRENGDIALFCFFTDEFAVFTADGLIRTYYKPEVKKHGLEMNTAYFMKDLYDSWMQDRLFELYQDESLGEPTINFSTNAKKIRH